MMWLYLFPKEWCSFLIGLLVRIPWPRPLGLLVNTIFIKVFKINMAEAEHNRYPTINALFTRKLKEGVRPLGSSFYVHPVDGKITECGSLDNGQLLQAKNKMYLLHDLVGSHSLCDFDTQHCSFMTYYLCPTDYHRVHSPVSGQIVEACYFPGRLWPVNPWAVDHISHLLSTNERISIKIQTEKGFVFVVLVGALNVGHITLSFESEVRTTKKPWRRLNKKVYDTPLTIKKGDELGIFNMGSTVVMVAENTVFDPDVDWGSSKGAVQVRSDFPSRGGATSSLGSARV